MECGMHGLSKTLRHVEENMNISCALVDDNINDIQTIQNIIFKISFGTDTSIITNTFQNSNDPNILQEYDLYIFDIDMPSLSGFDLAYMIYQKYPNATIIVCTMHDNLVFESFKLNAFYFVRKTNLVEDLQYSIKKYLSSFNRKDIYIARTTCGLVKIKVSSIIYFEVVHNNIYIHCASSETKERKSLQKVFSEMKDYGFIQVGKSFIINLAHITNVNNYKLTLSNNQIITIPKSQFKIVREKFLSYYSS